MADVREAAPLEGGIIAAGEGSRLRQAGFTAPKPLVAVAGVPLIASVIGNFMAAGVVRIRIIVNEHERDCVDFVRARFPTLDADFVVKTTASSLESFREVAGARDGGRMLVSTVDAWCPEDDFVRFVRAARRRPIEATVLGVTPLVADENPLWVERDDAGRITALGGSSGSLVTAGLYLVSSRVRQTPPPAGLGRLRDYLGWLSRSGEPLYAEIVETVVDVDRGEDVALAEALAAGRR
jgi:NDP-sugar pyrophosphorylase family protein